jgi:putative ABC transport system substrate-binding protein
VSKHAGQSRRSSSPPKAPSLALRYVDSIARPGANVTGLFFQHLGLLAKRFGLFSEMLPAVGLVAVLSDSLTADQLKEVEAANRSVGLDLQPVMLKPALEN